MNNKIHINDNFGWFIGNFENNQSHKHYAIQLCIPLENKISIKTNTQVIETDLPILIQSNINHQVISNAKFFLLLLNPASTLGHFWKNLFSEDIKQINSPATTELKRALVSKSFSSEKINSIINKYDCFCDYAIHKEDKRINMSLAFLSKNSAQVVSLEEIADYCALSKSRFLHLFKEQTGITFRRAQLWLKVRQAILLFGKKPLTEIAHEVGFSDSGHLSRTVKENFGFSPRDFIKLSQFIQV
ncbi:helix-turn-helix domain-containing protein [Bernardetia sp.]|uniref:helix-turn-helix domain-containing protein n=1 Tax=Bernardetia sp. TaxID=1937974 RepID=UPI0025C6EE7B|nr:AraC family transcriptional regulator [Bernardetia sp.]